MARKKKADIGSINITSSNSAFEGVQLKLDTEIDTSQIGSEVSKAVQVGIENGTKEAIKKISTKPTSSKTQKITKDAGLESKISSLNENISHFGTQIDKLTSEFRSFRKDFSKSNSNKSTSKSVKTSTKLVKTLTKPSEEYKISSSFIKQVVKDALADERRVINSGITSINSKDIKRGFYDVEESPDYYNKLSVRAQKYDHKRLKKFYEEEIAPSRFNDIKDLSLKSYEDLPVVKQNFKKLQEKYAEERKAQISYQESLVKAPFSGTPLAHPYHRAYIEEQRNKAVWNYTGGYINPFHESPELKLTAQQRSFDTFKETIQKEQEDLANLIADMREARQRARDSEDYIKSEADRLKEVKQKKEVDEEEVAVAKQKIKEEKEQAKQAKQQQKDQEKQQKRFSKGILSFLPGGGGMNNVLRMLGAGNPILSGLFVVGQGILGILNRALPVTEALNDLLNILIYQSIFKVENAFESISSLVKEKNNASSTTAKSSNTNISPQGTKISQVAGLDVVPTSSLVRGNVGSTALYTKASNAQNVRALDEWAKSRGYEMLVTSTIGGKHQESTDPSTATHKRGDKIDVQFKKNGRIVRLSPAEETMLFNAGYKSKGAYGYEEPNKFDNKYPLYDLSINQKNNTLMPNYSKYNNTKSVIASTGTVSTLNPPKVGIDGSTESLVKTAFPVTSQLPSDVSPTGNDNMFSLMLGLNKVGQ